MDLGVIHQLIQPELIAVDQLITQHLTTPIPSLQQAVWHVFNGQGKKLRPSLLLAAAKLCAPPGTTQIQLAAAMEIIHTATLLHDDIIDASELRRQNITVNAKWGNKHAVLVGNWLFSKAFDLIMAAQDPKLISMMAEVTQIMVRGEFQQLAGRQNWDFSAAQYYEIIYAKTAVLFEACLKIGAFLSSSQTELISALANYGRQLGLAFQISDDIIDYSSETATMGKKMGDDFREGRPTLPLIFIFQAGSKAQQKFLRQALKAPEKYDLKTIRNFLHEAGALNYAAEAAQKHIQQACHELQIFPASALKDSLLSFAELIPLRTN